MDIAHIISKPDIQQEYLIPHQIFKKIFGNLNKYSSLVEQLENIALFTLLDRLV